MKDELELPVLTDVVDETAPPSEAPAAADWRDLTQSLRDDIRDQVQRNLAPMTDALVQSALARIVPEMRRVLEVELENELERLMDRLVATLVPEKPPEPSE